jgi:hypothetical protein
VKRLPKPLRSDLAGKLPTLEVLELYRACFMPLKMGVETILAIYGSFNFRFLVAANIGENCRRAETDRRQPFTEPPASALRAN